MKDIIKELTAGIKLNTDYISRIKKDKETVDYMNSLDFDSMPQEIKEMNISILNRAKKSIEENIEDFVLFEEGAECGDCFKYADSYKDFGKIKEIYGDIDSIDSILASESLTVTGNIRKLLEAQKEGLLSETEKHRNDLIEHIEKNIKSSLFGKEEKADEPAPEVAVVKKAPERSFIVKKTNKSFQEIKDIIQEYIRINEQIFNKIIFESKPATLSISDRILDIYFKPGSGYVVNFISEPDTNYGKFYRNLLKVFSEIRDHVYDNYDIVISPEDGKSISYLNSFYQNYIFVREKIDTALTQFKLQNSLLNENFSVKYMIFEKISAKYLIFYTGNKDLSKAVEQYFVNQAKLGTMQFEIEFVEYDGDIKDIVMGRLNGIRNRIDLNSADNYMRATSISNERNEKTLLFNVTGVKILVDPETDYPGNDIDIVVMTNARDSHTDQIPKIMSRNPSAKLFTSDISFKIARIKWMKELNNPNLIPGSSAGADYTRKDIEGINERVIRITPMGKGYNYKNLVNIKFFSSGSIPGASIVEIRDAGHKTIYTGVYTREDTSLLRGSDTDFSEYNYIYYPSGNVHPYLPLPLDMIIEKLDADKQVFVFTDSLGNLQHAVTELYSAGIKKPIVSGDASFDIINKELSKIINFGSSWGDNFTDRDLYSKSIARVEPFTDEYEFYKKFSLNESLVFILPFDKMELEMVLKNKLYSDNLIFIPADYEKEFNEIVENDPVIPDEYKTGKHIIYNYIRNTDVQEMFSQCKGYSQFKKIITDSEIGDIPDNKKILINENVEKQIY
ncbi:MAG: hypothetical protein RBS89_01830 [Candidatus Delongbacteria bacterium]|jgi:hypothetical protein|nr:hypothetical protein [Candidatus Delongbacteria bacterium]